MPGDLYHYLQTSQEPVSLQVNGEAIPLDLDKGFALVRRRWQAGDMVELKLPMPVRRVLSHEAVKANVGRVALERGPLVYCAEWVDNGGQTSNLVLPDGAPLRAEGRPDLLNGVTVIKGRALGLYQSSETGEVETREQPFEAIPYYAWGHRGLGEMAVWLPRKPDLAQPVSEGSS